MFLVENESAKNKLIDVCQLDYQQRIFLCHQIVKQDDLQQELDLQNQVDTDCILGQIKCPGIVIREKESQKPRSLDYNFYLENSSRPNTVVINQKYWAYQYQHKASCKSHMVYRPCGLILGIQKDYLDNLKITSN